MSAQGDVLNLEPISVGAFVGLPLPFWFVAAAVVVPYDCGNQLIIYKE